MAFKLLPEEPIESKITPREIGETAIRTPLVAGAGVLASMPGFAGNILSGLNTMIANPLVEALGGESVPYEQTAIGKLIPTTQTHVENIEKAIPFLKPRNKFEKFGQDISREATELFLPGKFFKMGEYAFSPLGSLGISLASNIGKEGVVAFTGDEGKGEAVKNGMMLGLSLLNPKKADTIAGQLYSKASTLLPQNATVNATRLNQGLNSIEQYILRGRPLSSASHSEKWVIDQINKIRVLEQNGNYSIEQLTAQKKSVNEELQKFVFETSDRVARNSAKKVAKRLNGELRSSLSEYGQQNPEWWKYQSAADKAHGVMEQSNFISRMLEKFMKGRPEGLAHAFGIGLPTGLGILSPTGALATTAAYRAAKVGYRIWHSPELKKHYAKVVGAAAAGNIKLVNSELDSLESALEKENEEKPKYKLLPQ